MSQNLLKFITCGSVDDGKSTLIGRLLYDSNLLYTDCRDLISKDDPNFAVILDGLKEEREQGITIDVAYRYFSTAKRKFIVIDCPGHEQYTRNMVTGASNANFAIILIDVQNGVTAQTIRHASIAATLSLKNILVAVNKMDLANYSQDRFTEICNDFADKTKHLHFSTCQFIPISALHGDNLIFASHRTKWYTEQPLLDYLENVSIDETSPTNPDNLFMPIQYVSFQNGQRIYYGKIICGELTVNDEITIMPSAIKVSVKSIFSNNSQQNHAKTGANIAFSIDKHVDINRGDFVCKSKQFAPLTDYFTANMIWMSHTSLSVGNTFLLKIGSKTTTATIKKIDCVLDIATQQLIDKSDVEFNDLAKCSLQTCEKIPFKDYVSNKEMGGFILIDRANNETVACGMMLQNLDNSLNIFEQKLDIIKDFRAKLKMQQPCIIWFTGLSCSGKSTIANELERKFYKLYKHTYILDGDNIRFGLNQDLAFSDSDRHENIRRISEVARLMVDAGLIVLVAAISPFKEDRD
ncbi:MAG: GTP-binding protein, partial [Bacteroidales bacterium]|nr:GTP-binding protein [Bacteroidales bacterium]